MGLGVGIGGGIMGLTMLAVIVTSTSSFESISDISEAESEFLQLQRTLGDTLLQIDDVIASEKNDEMVFLLTNTGTSKVWNFLDSNLFITYDAIVDGTTTQITESLTFRQPTESTQVNCDGSIQGLQAGEWAYGDATQDNLDPGILNPNEIFQLSAKLNYKFAINGNGTIQFTSPEGYSLNKQFSMVNGTAECSWFDPDWKSRNKITINSDKILANFTDYPLMFTARDVDFKELAQTDGDDFIFTSSDKITQLDHEIESFDKDRSELTAWVRIPTLSSVLDTEIYIYYGNDDATNSENAVALWDNNYTAVYHLDESPDNSADQIKDSTQYANHATSILMEAGDSQSGMFGKSIVFDGVEEYMTAPNSDSLDNTGNQFTLEAWGKVPSPNNDDAPFLMKSPGTNQERYMLGLDGGTNPAKINFRTTTDVNHYRYDEGGIENDVWHYVAAVYNGTLSSNPRLFAFDNGDIVASEVASGNLLSTTTQLQIAKRNDNRWLQGEIEELRISNVTRSSDLIKTQYYNTFIPEDFYTFEPKEPFLIWADLGWEYRKEITIDKDLINAELDDFPLLVSVTDSDLTNAQSSGNDLVFTSSEGRIQLDHELEFFDSSDGTIVSWIRVPTLSDTDDTTLYMYYGHNTTTNVENIEEVWDSNYQAVYHLKEQAVSESLEFEPTDMNSAAIAKIESATDKFAMWAPRDFSNGGFIHTVDIDVDGTIDTVIETQQFSGLGQDPDVIHVDGDVYAVVYEGPSEYGWIVTSEILSDGTIGDHTGTRSTYEHLDAFNFASGNEIDEPDIIHIDSTVYAVAYSYFGNDLYLETLDIPNDGAEITTIENGNLLDGDGDYPEIINIGTDRYAIAYQDESNDGQILTIDIDSAGNIGSTIDSWEYETSNGETPDILNIAGDVYALAYEGPNSDGFIRTINITDTGFITKTGYDLSDTQLEFDTNTGKFPDILQIFQEIYAIVYTGPGNDGYLKTLAIYPNGTISSIIDIIEFDTTNGERPHIKLIDGDVYVIAYEGASNDGYVSTLAINKDGIIGDTAFDSTSNDNTGTHISEPHGTTGFIGTGVDLEASNNEYIDIPDSSSLDITGEITISAWVLNENDDQSAWETIIAKGDDTYRLHMCANGPVSCNVGETTDGFSFVVNTPAVENLGSTVNPVANEWHYVVGTYDGTTQTLYANSTASTLTTVSQLVSGNINTNNYNLAIGENLQQTGRYWDGIIDEVRISNIARSLEWIEAEFLNQASPNTFMSFGPEEQIGN